ncbi:hypothetical protein phiLo_14 [Thermus phage phiLo]|nr:hypothetical protein phiLo_14 [Thermus phage phiLo]
MSKPSKKQQVLEALFKECQKRGVWEFDNDLVREVASNIGFGNPFDATKVDTSDELPDIVRQQGYCVVHLGKGRHRFIPELKNWYHVFEEIDEENETVKWRYRKSLLNDLDMGEASVLSFVYNQHILHDFLYKDVVASPKIYIPGRTKMSLQYKVGNTEVIADQQQMEMDLVLEYLGTVTVLEAKSSFNRDFAVYQLFHPFRFYLKQKEEKKDKDKKDQCLLRPQTDETRTRRERAPNESKALPIYVQRPEPDGFDSPGAQGRIPASEEVNLP